MMKMVKNRSKRLVSIRCNSGETRHLAPGHAVVLANNDLDNNAMVDKLRMRKVLVVSDVGDSPPGKADKSAARSSSSPSTGKQSSKSKSK